MPQLATAYLPFPPAPEPTKVAETLAAIVEAGRTITALRAALVDAERTIANLLAEKRTLKAELRAVRHGTPAPVAPARRTRSHRDETIAALVEGLGPDMVRLAPDA